MTRGSTTDDRGTPCRVAALSGRQLGSRALGIEALHDEHTSGELAVTDRLELACAIGGGVVASAVWQILWLRLQLGSIFGLFAGLVVIAPAAGLLSWWGCLGTIRRRRFRRVADVYLSSGRCASCEYALAGLEPEADGCLVCPECGAAWRAERVRAEPDAT